jgi:hypothetical protein
MNGSARGTALAVLFVAVPFLVVAIFRVSRGAVCPVISWLGATAFLLYNAVLFLFATPFRAGPSGSQLTFGRLNRDFRP